MSNEAAKDKEENNVVDLEDPNLTLEEPTEDSNSDENNDDTKDNSTSVPEKFKGKSVEEVAKIYSDLESEFTKQSQELQKQSASVNALLEQQLQNNNNAGGNSTETEKDNGVTFDDVVSDPEASINKVANAAVNKVKEKVDQLEKKQQMLDFRKKHPDYLEVGDSEEFAKFVKATKHRTSMFLEAHNNSNLAAADTILTEFKASQGSKSKRDTKNENDLNDVTTDSDVTGGSNNGGKPVFSRQQIRHIRQHKPEVYKKHEATIRLAYKEGRVTD